MENEADNGSLHKSDFIESPETVSPPPALPLPPSKQPPKDFGDYQFIELLGRGGFGVVYKVWSLSKCRYEAMKILEHKGAPGGERLEEFRHEVQRMANVPGTQVAHVYHVGVLPDGRPFFTMEYLSGGRLDRFCARSRLSIEDRIRLMADVCNGVHRLHELKLIHCDIKPGNILIAEEGETAVPKLVDFGLARHLALRTSPTKGPAGTLQYMSPEQLENRSGDPQRGWDIYALGVTLYELLVGACPIDPMPESFPVFELAADLVRKTPIPPLRDKLSSNSKARSDEIARERRLSVDGLRHRLEDPWLEAVVDKALAKHRDERFATGADMARNLLSCVRGRRPPIVPPTPKDRVVEFVRDHRLAVAVPTILVMVAALSFWAYRSNVAARRSAVDALFDRGCSEIEPAAAIRIYQQALELDPTRSDVRLHLASAYISNGEAETAMETAREISDTDPNYGHAQAFVRGVNQFRAAREGERTGLAPDFAVSPGEEYYYSLSLGSDKAKLATDLLTQALQKGTPTFEERFRLRLLRAMRYHQMANFESLDSETHWLVTERDKSAVAWNLRGLACSRTGRLDEAGAAFDQALRLNPQYAVVYVNRAWLDNVCKRFPAALQDCERARELEPALAPFVQSARIAALVGSGAIPAARAECEQLQDDHHRLVQTHLMCGDVWLAEQPQRAWGQFDRAVTGADRLVLDRDELKYTAVLKRGLAAFRTGRYSDAIQDLDAAEKSQGEKWRADLKNYEVRGFAHLFINQASSAAADLEIAASSATDGALYYLWIWDAYLSEGKVPEAQAALRQAKEAATKDQRLARIVAHCAGEVEPDAVINDAASDLTKKIEALYYLGLAAKAHGDRQGAHGYFDKCRQLSSKGVTPIECKLAEMQLSRLDPIP